MELIRAQQLLMLLDAIDANWDKPQRTRDVVTAPAFRPAKRVRCLDCHGEQTECKMCEGCGFVWVDAMKSERPRDQVVGPAPTLRRPRAKRPASGQFIGAARQKRKSKIVDPTDAMIAAVDTAVQARKRRNQAGSFEELEQALDALCDVDMTSRFLIGRALIERDARYRSVRFGVLLKAQALEMLGGVQANVELDELVGANVDRVWRGLAFIESKMGTIRVPMELAIRLEQRRGKGERQISRDLGISRFKVQKAIRREAA